MNVLVALAWPNHVHHRVARDWFDAHAATGWATTPVTESGFVRVSSNRAVIVPAATPSAAIELLTAMTALGGHEFWSDDVAHVDGGLGSRALITSHRDVTDAHLLAVAQARGGALVTLDARIGRLLGDRPGTLIQHLASSVTGAATSAR